MLTVNGKYSVYMCKQARGRSSGLSNGMHIGVHTFTLEVNKSSEKIKTQDGRKFIRSCKRLREKGKLYPNINKTKQKNTHTGKTASMETNVSGFLQRLQA